jgi:hypothetical protein
MINIDVGYNLYRNKCKEVKIKPTVERNYKQIVIGAINHLHITKSKYTIISADNKLYIYVGIEGDKAVINLWNATEYKAFKEINDGTDTTNTD